MGIFIEDAQVLGRSSYFRLPVSNPALALMLLVYLYALNCLK